MYVIKSMRESQRVEHCPKCSNQLQRVYQSYAIVGAKTIDPYYSHALGKMVASPKQERLEAEAKGLVEVGNEDLKKHIKPPESKYPTVTELYQMGAFNGLSS